MNPSVCVVIPTFNRQQRLARTLASLEAQDVQRFEVVVVDDASDPPVESVLPSRFLGRPDITVLRQERNLGPAAARNRAIEFTAAQLIAFLDDDVDAGPGWLSAHLQRWAESGERTVVIGPLLAPPDWRPTAWNRWEADRVAREYRRMTAGEYAPTWRQFFTGNALAERAQILAAGGFNEGFRRAEDVELALRLSRAGNRLVFEPEAKGWHYAHRRMSDWLANAERYAHFEAQMDALYPDMDILGMIQDELNSRRLASRVVRGAARGVLGDDLSVAVACRVAPLLNRRPLTPLAVGAASLAYDIRYRAAVDAVSKTASALRLAGGGEA